MVRWEGIGKKGILLRGQDRKFSEFLSWPSYQIVEVLRYHCRSQPWRSPHEHVLLSPLKSRGGKAHRPARGPRHPSAHWIDGLGNWNYLNNISIRLQMFRCEKPKIAASGLKLERTMSSCGLISWQILKGIILICSVYFKHRESSWFWVIQRIFRIRFVFTFGWYLNSWVVTDTVTSHVATANRQQVDKY